MNGIYSIVIGGAAICVTVAVFIIRSLNGRMAAIEEEEKTKVDEKFCDERYDHVGGDIKETKECLVAIKERLNAIEISIAAWPTKNTEAVENLLARLKKEV